MGEGQAFSVTSNLLKYAFLENLRITHTRHFYTVSVRQSPGWRAHLTVGQT